MTLYLEEKHENSSYEEIYEIIKKHEPITHSEIGKLLVTQNRFTQEDFNLSIHSEIAGYLSNLSQNGLIEKIAAKDMKTKTSNKLYRWRIKKKVK